MKTTLSFDEFLRPPDDLRPVLFWAINERLNDKKLARQYRDIRRRGFGGVIYHARAGLITEYLGKGWLDGLAVVLDAAREAGGHVWLYDEDRWPSGQAGGQVTARRPELRQAWLEPAWLPAGAPCAPAGPDAPVKAVYLIRERTGLRCAQVERGDAQQTGDLAAERLVIRLRRAEPTAWWNGQPPANLLDPAAAEVLLTLTHDVYRQRFGREFGRLIPGIFTDEPRLPVRPGAIPWWDGLPEAYQAWQQRDWWADLPWLFLDGPESHRVRLAAQRTIHRQFVEGWSGKLGEWCRRFGLAWTGHFQGEHAFADQIAWNGGGVAAHYRHQHLPGVDALRREVDTHLPAYKQVASAARQLGRPRALNEIFGAAGHATSFEEFRWMADASLAAGVTLLVPHLGWYSLRGRRKRDYPPNWNYQQTYWDDLHLLTDYIARTAVALELGRPDCGILVLSPIEAAMSAYRREVPMPPGGSDTPAPLPELAALEQVFRLSLLAALETGRDADVGDEAILAESARAGEGLLHIGDMTYHTVLVPAARGWRTGTFQLLDALARQGGHVYFVGRVPEEAEGVPFAGWQELARQRNVRVLAADPAALALALEHRPAAYRLADNDQLLVPGLRTHHRVGEQQEVLLVANTRRDAARDLTLRLYQRGGWKIEQWDAAGGGRRLVPSHAAGAQGADLECRLRLEPMGSCLLVATPSSPLEPAREPDWSRAQARTLHRPWTAAPRAENVLVLDRLAYSLDQGATWSAVLPDHQARREIAAHFGLAEALEWQPYAALQAPGLSSRGGPVTLRYTFESTFDTPPPAALVMENLQAGDLRINGHKVHTEKAGWHWDTGFGKKEITELLQKGRNAIEYTFPYDLLGEIEPAYLVGRFGVFAADTFTWVIGREPTQLRAGSWIHQGFPFYAGGMGYRTEFRLPGDRVGCGHVAIRLRQPAGALFRVRVNDQDGGVLCWRPWLKEITPWTRAGVNQLEIEVVASLQNALGPLHAREGAARARHGPRAFEQPDQLTDAYTLAETGLLGGVELLTC